MESIKEVKNFKVLIVDDIIENIKVLGNTLKENGLQVFTAMNGKQALTIAIAKLPDIILLDVQMPEMDGFEVCTQMKANPNIKDIPIIFLTAKTDTVDILRGFELGAVDYITKPFKLPELLARVFTHLNLKYAKETIIKQNKEISDESQKNSELNYELNMANETLIKSEKNLKILNATKDKFFSIIAHDLKGPISTTMGLFEILNENLSSLSQDELREIIGEMKKSTEKTYSLLENLLDWSRSQRDLIEYKFETNPLNPIIDNLIDLFEPQLKNKNISMINDFPNEILCNFDRNTITTVLRNLFSNALKFTSSGVIRITGEESGEKVIISVIDSGMGIKPDDQKKLFKTEENFTTRGTNGEKGTGLGLVLCREFVEKNNGRIWVESEIEKGSSFKFTLPKSSLAE